MHNKINLRFPGGRAKAFTTSYDDNVEQDLRLVAIMRKNGIKGTFNLNSGVFPAEGTTFPAGQIHRRMSPSLCHKAYDGGDMEVAVHGYIHPFWTMLPTSDCVCDIIDDRRKLEKEFGCLVRGAAYPYGAFNDDVVDILDKCGLVYCRTTVATHNFEMPKNWLTLHPTCHHNDPQLNDLADKFLSAKDDHVPQLFYLWGHSYEFDINDNWQLIEDFLAKIGGHDDVWYATNIEIYDYAKAFEKLIYSADGKTVCNPTCTDLWLHNGKETFAVGAGKTVCIDR